MNLARLRKVHADLKKEIKKQEETSKKENEALKKEKKRLEEELRTAVLENTNHGQEKSTMADILGCLKQLVDKKNENETFSARKVYICNISGSAPSGPKH